MSDGHRHYFAYGSNLHVPQMASLAPAGEPVGLGRLADWELFLNDHGVLSIRPSDPPCEVLGLVWRCTDADLEALDRFEAVDEGLYQRSQLMVAWWPTGAGQDREPAGGVLCEVYRSVSTATGHPRPGYLEGSVLPPMRDLGLPTVYVARLEGWLAAGSAGPPWTPVPAPGDVFTNGQPRQPRD